MRQELSGCSARRRGMPHIVYVTLLGFSFIAPNANAQGQRPFLFATTQVNGNPAVATFTRDDANGTLAEVAGSPFPLLTPGCYPAAIDPQGRFLLGPCSSGISFYTLNSATGVVEEVPKSPFAASTGATPVAAIAESTGQFAYALRVTRTTFPTPSPATLDSFVIDAANNVLSQPSTQSFNLPGAFLGVVSDPNHHFLQIFLAQSDGGVTPIGASCAIQFNLQTGLPESAASGLCQVGASGGENPVGISIDGRGTLIGTASRGQSFSSIDVFAISPNDGSQQASGSFTFTDTNNSVDTPFFDPTGQLVYVTTQQTGLRIFSVGVAQGVVTLAELASSPLPANLNAAAVSALPNPAADFTYVGGSNSILAYPIDSSSGYPGTPVQNTFNHSPALDFQPILATVPPPGQPVSAPAVSISTQALSFGPINPGQVSAPQTVIISSTGNEALIISSIALNPATSPFSETDTCLAHPVLAPGTSCQVSLSYAPTATGTSRATLVIADNAPGSPQNVQLSGTAVPPSAPAPDVTLVPGALNFPGATTQGESSAPQPVTISNSGNATLTFNSAPALNGANLSDFLISSSTCGNSLVANASCTLMIVFSPLAAGVRTTGLVISDNAANSPQSVSINGSANASAMISASTGGAMSASVSAGQPAQYQLQATPSAGYSGTLTFACSGLPLGTSCNTPAVTLTSGSTSNFSFTIATTGNAAAVPTSLPGILWRVGGYSGITMLLVPLFALWLLWLRNTPLLPGLREGFRGTGTLACAPGAGCKYPQRFVSACLALALLGCGGGGGSAPPTPQVVTPSGTYNIIVTPSATASGSNKALTLNPLNLTLIVK